MPRHKADLTFEVAFRIDYSRRGPNTGDDIDNAAKIP